MRFYQTDPVSRDAQPRRACRYNERQRGSARTPHAEGGAIAASRPIVLRQGYRYRGKTGMLNWALHRITGLGIVLFVGLHVIAAFGLQQFGNDLATAVTAFYESWPFQIFVYFCVLFHAFNGTRVALVDLLPALLRYQRELYWLQWIIFLPAYLLPVFFLVQTGLGGG